MFDNIASFDIGYSSVKLIIAKRGIRNFEILSASIEEYDLDLYATDSLSAINDAVQRIIERVDLSDSIVITTFPSDRVIFRNITFPFNEQSKISDTIKFEAEESIPYPVEMVSLAFQMLPPSDTGRPVILSALKKDFIKEKINNIKDYGFSLQFAGIEGNAHLRCYEYFNSVNDENILVIDLGHKKTVIDIISNSSLLYTRSINAGLSDLIEFISETLNTTLTEAGKILKEMDLDLSSYDSFISSDSFKRTGISKPKMKKIHEYACDVFNRIVEEISLTIKAGSSFNEFIEFSRIIVTGGGSNIRGISKILSDETGIPVVFMPFLSGFSDADFRSRFTVSLGSLLVFMNHKNASINFLQGEFSADPSGDTTKKYLLPAVFMVLAITIFVINIIITFIQVTGSQSYTEDILIKKYKRYFNSQTIPSDPVKEASQLVQKEQKELNVLKELIGIEEPFIPTLSLITDSFQGAEGFDIKKLNFDGKSISIEGETAKSSDLENFKKNLLDSGEFESVSLNIRDTSKSRNLFTMTIKKKL